MRDQVLRDYEWLEPERSDSWNPLHSDVELGYRMSLTYSLTRSLRLCDHELSDLKVLDVGCGNGRSSRMYIDLGLKPEQMVSVDYRPETIELARSLHPAITYDVCSADRIDAPDGTYNWVQATTVFSSIADPHHRHHLAREMVRTLAPGGYVFYFDLRKANWFAGGDVLDAEGLFSDLTVVWSSTVRSRRCFPRMARPRIHPVRPSETRLARFKRFARPRSRIRGILPSHRVLLVRKN